MSYSIRFLLFSAILSATGCSLTSEHPAVHDFGNSQAKPGTQKKNLPDIAVVAPKWLQDSRIRYRLLYSDPSRVRFYGMNRWIAPPGDLLEQQFKFSEHIQNCSLKITLLDFEQQFVSPEQSRVMVRLFAEAHSSDHRRLIGTREFRLEQWTQTPDAVGAVDAFTELAQKASDQIAHWLKEAMGSP